MKTIPLQFILVMNPILRAISSDGQLRFTNVLNSHGRSTSVAEPQELNEFVVGEASLQEGKGKSSKTAKQKGPTHSPTRSPPTPTYSSKSSKSSFSPVTSKPTISSTTSRPTGTTSKPTVPPTTSAPTVPATTSAPTVTPTTSEPTISPTTSTPTLAPTASPTTFSPTVPPTSSMPTLPPTSSVTRSPSAPQTAKLDDSNPPNCTDQSDIDGIIVFSGGADDGETGIATVSLIAGAQNLNLTVNPFTIGDQTVTFEATRVNDTLPAMGTILVTDRAGFNCTLDVALEPFDFEIFSEQAEFAARLHLDLFGAASADEHPFYNMTEIIPESAGMYQATNKDGTSFFVQISSIVIPSSELITSVLEDATQVLIDAANDGNTSLFAFRGYFHFGGISIEVVALALTVSASSAVMAIYDPTDLFGITDANDEVDLDLEFPNTPALPESESTTAYSNQSVVGKELALVPHGRNLQSESCSNALSEAIEAANCEAPEQPYINQPCVAAATFAYNTAVDVVRGQYDTAIQVAKAIYYGVMIELNRRRIKEFAKALIPCVLVGLLSGPLWYAICAARALAIAVAKMMALQLAAEAALELAKRNAEATLRAALFAACNAFRLALFACVRCVQCVDPEQQPCGDVCYDPTTHKCCPEEAVAAKESCCPNERSCPDGLCIPQDSCCPDEKPCSGSCIPKKDCCDATTSRHLFHGFEENLILHRNLQEDPCCADPNDECCGSDDECCGSEDPCCGSNDQCCGSGDPCCGSSNACCGQPDCGGSSGDPHITTFDGLHYDCQGRGEFVLVAAGDAVVQVRFKKVGRVSVNSGVAVSEGPGSTIVEISLGVDRGGPILVVNGAVINPPSLGYEDSSVIVVSTSSDERGPFRITYKSSNLGIFVQYYEAFNRYMNINVGLPQVLRDLGTVGLLGSADNDPTNDWMLLNGTALPIPPLQSGRIGLSSLNYCKNNWCIQDEASTLFTYYEESYNFTFFSGCNDLDEELVDISNPPPEAAMFCGVDTSCLVDFIEGGQTVAQQTLAETAKLDAMFTIGSLVANPAAIAANGQSVNVALSVNTVANGLGVEEFAIYRVDSVTGDQIGERAVVILVGDSNNGVFTGSINVFSNTAGEAFGFRAVPVVNGAEDPTSPATILRLVAVRSFSDGSGVVDKPDDSGCQGPCDDGDLCTIDFCLNSVCRTEPVACEIGRRCDPFSGRCLDVENLVPCIAIIDEWDNNAYNSEWAEFRQRFPQRPFCLLVPNTGIQTLPTGFDEDTVYNPDGIDRTIAELVNRDEGDVGSASNWTSICGLDSLTPQNTQFVGLFVDDSGSMRVSTVSASLEKFEADMAALGIEIRRVVNGVERWIDPFLTNLVPVSAA